MVFTSNVQDALTTSSFWTKHLTNFNIPSVELSRDVQREMSSAEMINKYLLNSSTKVIELKEICLLAC